MIGNKLIVLVLAISIVATVSLLMYFAVSTVDDIIEWVTFGSIRIDRFVVGISSIILMFTAILWCIISAIILVVMLNESVVSRLES